MPTVLPASGLAQLQQAGQARGAGALGQVVRRRQQEADRLGDLRLGHGHESGQPLPQGAEGERVGVAGGQAVGERVGRGLRDGPAGVPRVVDGRGPRGLHAVDGQPGRSARATVSPPTACEPPPTETTSASIPAPPRGSPA